MKTRCEQRPYILQKQVDDSPASRVNEKILTQFQELQTVVIQFGRSNSMSCRLPGSEYSQLTQIRKLTCE